MEQTMYAEGSVMNKAVCTLSRVDTYINMKKLDKMQRSKTSRHRKM